MILIFLVILYCFIEFFKVIILKYIFYFGTDIYCHIETKNYMILLIIVLVRKEIKILVNSYFGIKTTKTGREPTSYVYIYDCSMPSID